MLAAYVLASALAGGALMLSAPAAFDALLKLRGSARRNGVADGPQEETDPRRTRGRAGARAADLRHCGPQRARILRQPLTGEVGPR